MPAWGGDSLAPAPAPSDADGPPTSRPHMTRLDRAGLALLAGGIGLSLANLTLAALGRPLAFWRAALAGLLLTAGVAALAVVYLRGRRGER